MFYARFVKRIFDFSLALILLLFFSPALIFISVAVAIQQKGRPLFFQARPGMDNRIFQLIKFKTMSEVKDSDGNLFPDDKRLSHFGNFLRKTSLDELPQLINVLKGEMSLVGPRPLLIDYLPLYNQYQAQRHRVRPGVTGWAQINGRNAITWEKKFDYDVWYVNNQSFFLDFKILFLTIWNVLLVKGITQEGHVTSERFNGNF